MNLILLSTLLQLLQAVLLQVLNISFFAFVVLYLRHSTHAFKIVDFNLHINTVEDL